ncbi:MAG: helix-turn-helix domain-containing protein [Phycisphaerae bacterium]|nr:helix-turn-helix domain-containing protein [Phycisphaerae bacterium]
MECNIDYETLAAYVAGDLDEQRVAALDAHVLDCRECSRRLRALERSDRALAELARTEPDSQTVLKVRRALANELRPTQRSAVMTLDQVAEFLQISRTELEPLIDELPAFDLGGLVRVRREKLLAWIDERERRFLRSRLHNDMAKPPREEASDV